MISEEIEHVEGGGKTCTTVIVNMYLRSINDIDDYKMEFSVQVTFREQWNDERLKFDDFGGSFLRTYFFIELPWQSSPRVGQN